MYTMPVLSIINDDFFLQRMDFFYFGECVSGEHILVLALFRYYF